jgi:multiple sugar transport system substrate-binding protein
MPRTRLALLLAPLAALAFLAAGCGGGGGTSGGGSSTGAAGTVQRSASDTLSIIGFGSGDEVAQARIALGKKAIAPAHLKNPTGAFNDQQFLTAVASGTVPDLIYLDRFKVGNYAARGALMPMTDCVKNQDVDMSQYRQAAVDEVTWDGTLYAIPEFSTNRVLIVDDSAAKASGVDPSDISTTDWPKLKQVTKKLTRMSGGKLTRIGFDPKIPEFFPLWARANGARIISDDGRHANLDDPKVVEALAYAVSLIDEQGGWTRFKSFRDTWDFFGSGNQVAKDQVGAWPMEDWYFNVLAQNSPSVKISTAPFTDRQGNVLDYTTGSAWAIPKGAKHPELACLWAKTVTSVPAWMAAARARLATVKKNQTAFTGLHTGNEVADHKIMDTLYHPDDSQWSKALGTVSDAEDHSFSLPASPAGAAFQKAWNDAINRVLAGQQSPKQALDQAQKEAQSALDAASAGG